jgi:cyclophilin family peptidyl-prolyl cis-trans isomerase
VILVLFMIFHGGGDGDEPSSSAAQPARTATSVRAAASAPTATPKPTSPAKPTADPRLGGGCWTKAQIASGADGQLQWSAPPAKVIATSKTYQATFQTSSGSFTVELVADQAPATVNNFVCLARAGYYDDTTFYRITATALQGGDPSGTGSGGPGYTIPDEPVVGDYTRGTLAMVNEGPNTNGSRFFVFGSDYAGLKRYPIFGHVVDGLDVIDQIVASADSSDPVVIESVTISST